MSAVYERPAAAPGYRDPFLLSDEASQAMTNACRAVVAVALDQRRQLLAVGFADSHSMCRELDAVAARWNENLLVVRDAAGSPREPQT